MTCHAAITHCNLYWWWFFLCQPGMLLIANVHACTWAHFATCSVWLWWCMWWLYIIFIYITLHYYGILQLALYTISWCTIYRHIHWHLCTCRIQGARQSTWDSVCSSTGRIHCQVGQQPLCNYNFPFSCVCAKQNLNCYAFTVVCMCRACVNIIIIMAWAHETTGCGKHKMHANLMSGECIYVVMSGSPCQNSSCCCELLNDDCITL